MVKINRIARCFTQRNVRFKMITKQRRKQLLDAMDDFSLFIEFAGNEIRRSADANYPFSIKRNFYYLTNIDEQEAVLILIKLPHRQSETLFIRDIDLTLQKWNGTYLTSTKASEQSEIASISSLSSLEGYIQSHLTRSGIRKIYVDIERLAKTDRVSVDEAWTVSMKQSYPTLSFENMNARINSMRTRKDKSEVDAIINAIDITKNAFERMLDSTKTAKCEYELQAEFEYVLKKHNATPAFDMIVASGKDATILHYVKNNKKIEDDSLVLCDMGASKDYYNSDISRTFPKSGQFTDVQKKYYNLVLEAMDRVFDKIRPGVTLKQLNDEVIDLYQTRLKEFGLIKESHEVSRYYYHGVSHFLGLDVHDVGQVEQMVLAPGQIITVEPGIYIEELGFGIRIEDDVLVTEDGYENLSAGIIKRIEDIENRMKGNG